jgi:hypothetical protein
MDIRKLCRIQNKLTNIRSLIIIILLLFNSFLSICLLKDQGLKELHKNTISVDVRNINLISLRQNYTYE